MGKPSFPDKWRVVVVRMILCNDVRSKSETRYESDPEAPPTRQRSGPANIRSRSRQYTLTQGILLNGTCSEDTGLEAIRTELIQRVMGPAPLDSTVAKCHYGGSHNQVYADQPGERQGQTPPLADLDDH
jgi:hypothetical protein